MGCVGTEGRVVRGTGLEGGVFQDSPERCSNTAFSYLSHSAVVIPCESAPTVPNGRKRGGRERPPQKGGTLAAPDSGTEFHTAIRPHAGSLSSSFIPAGRLGTGPRRGTERTETDL